MCRLAVDAVENVFLHIGVLVIRWWLQSLAFYKSMNYIVHAFVEC